MTLTGGWSKWWWQALTAFAGGLALVSFGVWAGVARAVTFTQKTVPFTGLRQPAGVAVDGGGDVFALSSAPAVGVVELPSGGSQRTLPLTGLSSPTGVAVDGTANVFVADSQNGRVVELPSGGSQQTLPLTGLTLPVGVAADTPGDVFIADAGARQIIELPSGGSQQTLPFSGLTDPEALTVDGAGDVFVVDTTAGSVVELPAGGSQQTIPSKGLNRPEGIAVDGAGDMFVADTGNNRVVELPAGGSQQTLPFTGLNRPAAVAVDLAGDVFVADQGNNRVVELLPSLTSGSFVLSPTSGPAGSSTGLASVTPCTLFTGGAFAATEAKLFLYSSAGQLLTSTTVPFGDLGSWAGSLRIPAGAANGTTFVVRARCTNAEGVMAQAYGPATFTVTGAARGLGGGRPSGPRLLGARSRCTKPKRSRKLCTYTFTYAVKTASSQPAIATVTLGAHHRRVIARGHVRRHRLTLVFGHLRRGRYKLTLLALDAHGRTATIGRTTIQIS